MMALLAAGTMAMALAARGSTPEDGGALGYLDVSSDPPAEIFIDGADIGQTTPAQHVPRHVGHHKLTLTVPDGSHKRTIGFTIGAGQTTQLTIHLTS
jgi:hypothetical protein